MGQKKRSKILHLLYEAVIFALVLTSLTFCILNLAGVIEMEHGTFHYIELSILAALWLDLIVRFFLSKEKERYLKENFLESIAILPFWKYLTLLHFLRLWEMFHCWERLGRAKNIAVKRGRDFIENARGRVRGFTNTIGFNHAFHIAVYILLTSAFIVSRAEGISYEAALSWSLATTATSGFGAPASGLRFVIAIILAITAVVVVGMLIATIVVYCKRRKKRNS